MRETENFGLSGRSKAVEMNVPGPTVQTHDMAQSPHRASILKLPLSAANSGYTALRLDHFFIKAKLREFPSKVVVLDGESLDGRKDGLSAKVAQEIAEMRGLLDYWAAGGCFVPP